MQIEVDIYDDVFLDCYQHTLYGEEYDIDFYYGGRDSGKSRHIAQKKVKACLEKDYFKCLLVRKVLNTVRDSQYSLIKSVIEEWGLESLFTFNDTRLEIRCVNGNGFYGRGLDDVGRIKSFNNPSDCWIEEGNQITSEDFTIILTSLRYNDGNVHTDFSFNPECDGNYTEFWLYQEYFAHTKELSFTLNKTIEVDDEPFTYKIRATHTTYRDNPYCKPQRKALYEGYKNSKANTYYYTTYTLGLWGYRITGGSFFKAFDTVANVAPVAYNPKDVISISVDNNVTPYITITVYQHSHSTKIIRQIDEVLCESPDNSASRAAKKLTKYLQRLDYTGTVWMYGDPSSNARSTNDDEGRSFFDKFTAELKLNYTVNNKVSRSAPAVSSSGDFVNELFEVGYNGWKLIIGENCTTSIEDYVMTKEASDGTVEKKRVKDKVTNTTYEKYGHCVDTLRYFVTSVLDKEFYAFSNTRKGGMRKLM